MISDNETFIKKVFKVVLYCENGNLKTEQTAILLDALYGLLKASEAINNELIERLILKKRRPNA